MRISRRLDGVGVTRESGGLAVGRRGRKPDGTVDF